MPRKVKCVNCGTQKETDLPEYRCNVCGAANVVPQTDGTGGEACTCMAPTGGEWTKPAGKLPDGLYVTAQGTHMTKEQFIEAYNTDPELALQYMRSGAAAKERDDDADLSTLNKRRAK